MYCRVHSTLVSCHLRAFHLVALYTHLCMTVVYAPRTSTRMLNLCQTRNVYDRQQAIAPIPAYLIYGQEGRFFKIATSSVRQAQWLMLYLQITQSDIISDSGIHASDNLGLHAVAPWTPVNVINNVKPQQCASRAARQAITTRLLTVRTITCFCSWSGLQ